MEEEGAHAFLQGAGTHGRRSQGTLSKFFSDLLLGSLWTNSIDHANKVYNGIVIKS